MEKKTITSQEVIWDNKTIKWTEKIETIYPETIEVPDYDYGTSQNTIDAEIALRNTKSWFTTASVAILTSTTTWSFDLTTPDIDFIPKAIRIQARMNWATPSVSDMSSDGVTSWGLYTVWAVWTFSDTRIIRIRVDASNEFAANFTEFIKWGVRIDVTHADFVAGDFVGCFITAWK